jgi:hypothetical protein
LIYSTIAGAAIGLLLWLVWHRYPYRPHTLHVPMTYERAAMLIETERHSHD